MAQAVKKVVLAVDGSPYAERALEFYLKTLYKAGHEVHLVHALEYPYIPAQPYVQKDTIEKLFESARDEGRKLEEKYKVILTEKAIPFKVHSEFGKPGELICNICKEEGANMVVMGTRGMGKVRRTFLGSVSDYVVHHAHCPVVISRTHNSHVID